MLVFGDHCEIASPSERLRAMSRDLTALAATPSGIERHALMVGVLIDAGQLQQGVEDAAGPSAAFSRFLYQLAQCVIRSWDSSFGEIGSLPLVPEVVLPASVELKMPEGFAFYAVYPEDYIEAARRLKLVGAPRVIGIRSIGTTLGAVTAAALGAPPPVTVRPVGDPFARQVELPEEIVDETVHYVVVDEGPGLSGSSFGAVADWLEERGVPLERIAFLPSHGGGPGRHASASHRERWEAAQRVPADFDARFLSELFGPLEPISAGSPVERLKFLARPNGERLLLKFAGLGSIGADKLDIARTLHAAGFTAEPLGLIHGFLVERWCDDALRLAAGDKPVREMGEYIGIRARLFPAPDGSGATIADLLAMCRRNLRLALGEQVASAIDRWNAATLALAVHRVRSDNKLDRDEWLRRPDGRLLKTDALDHHQAHDLVGCQDMAWDIAGAIVEFALSYDDIRQLIEAAEAAAGRRVNPDLLSFYRVAYCCFRLGAARMVAELCSDAAERERMSSRAMHYETAVISLLRHDYCCFTSQDSLVD